MTTSTTTCLDRRRRTSDAVVLHRGGHSTDEIRFAAEHGLELVAYCGARRVPLVIPPRPFHAVECGECRRIVDERDEQ